MTKLIRKTYKLPFALADHVKTLAEQMQVSENDVIKMLIFKDIRESQK